MEHIKIIRTTPLDGKMLLPGRIVPVDSGLATILKRSGKCVAAPEPASKSKRKTGKGTGAAGGDGSRS